MNFKMYHYKLSTSTMNLEISSMLLAHLDSRRISTYWCEALLSSTTSNLQVRDHEVVAQVKHGVCRKIEMKSIWTYCKPNIFGYVLMFYDIHPKLIFCSVFIVHSYPVQDTGDALDDWLEKLILF